MQYDRVVGVVCVSEDPLRRMGRLQYLLGFGYDGCCLLVFFVVSLDCEEGLSDFMSYDLCHYCV